MALIPWEPFREFDRFFEDRHWGFVPMLRSGSLAVDVYQTGKDVTAEATVPAGIDPEKLEISVEQNILTIKGSTESEREEKNRDYHRKEIRRGSFERTVLLPAPVKGGEAEAVFENGILKITMPKSEEARAKKITVKVKR